MYFMPSDSHVLHTSGPFSIFIKTTLDGHKHWPCGRRQFPPAKF